MSPIIHPRITPTTAPLSGVQTAPVAPLNPCQPRWCDEALGRIFGQIGNCYTGHTEISLELLNCDLRIFDIEDYLG